MWRRYRVVVATALLLVAGVSAWRAWARVRFEIENEVDAARGAPGLPEGAPARDAVPHAAAPKSASTPAVALAEVARGFQQPLFVAHAGDGSGRLFVVEQGGKIRIVVQGKVAERPFLDLSSVIDTSSGERGLLGLAFAPDYARSGRFFVSYTVKGAVRVARFRVSGDRDVADPAGTTILEMADPAGNHNGGMLAFGRDGFLYHGTGDGGSGGDPWNNAQNREVLLGKMLRLDVSGESYSSPPGNPYAKGGGRPELWLTGLRNPWRFSFDRETGELWIGDVGQNTWEEIDVATADSGGADFGWRAMEGFHCYNPREGCDPSGHTLPVHAYGHNDGCSVTGGYVYRGAAIPALSGAYLFGDYCTGRVWALRRDTAGRGQVETLLESNASISSFGEDEAGELYLCDHGAGRVLRFSAGG